MNHYTYVDIDPAIKDIAEKHFLREPARGEFIADDARRFVATSDRRFAAVVVDVYSAHTSIPSHLVTREFWQGTRRVLEPDGVLLANLILDGKLETPYARNLLATIDSVFGRCAVERPAQGENAGQRRGHLLRQQPAGHHRHLCRTKRTAPISTWRGHGRSRASNRP